MPNRYNNLNEANNKTLTSLVGKIIKYHLLCLVENFKFLFFTVFPFLPCTCFTSSLGWTNPTILTRAFNFSRFMFLILVYFISGRHTSSLTVELSRSSKLSLICTTSISLLTWVIFFIVVFCHLTVANFVQPNFYKLKFSSTFKLLIEILLELF